MLPRVLERLPQVEVVRCNFEPDGSASRTTSRTRSCPRTASSSSRRTHRGGRRVRGRVRRRRRPLLLRRRQRRVRARRLHDRAVRRVRCSRREPGGKVIYDVRASWAVPETIERGRRRAADQPRRPLVHQAADARGGRRLRRRGVGALLLPRLLPGRLGRDPVPADARARLAHGPAAERDPRAAPLAATSSPARSTRRSPTSR